MRANRRSRKVETGPAEAAGSGYPTRDMHRFWAFEWHSVFWVRVSSHNIKWIMNHARENPRKWRLRIRIV